MAVDLTKPETFVGAEGFHSLALGMSKQDVEAALGRALDESSRDDIGNVYFGSSEALAGHGFEMEHLVFNAVFKAGALTSASLIVRVGDKAVEAAIAKLVAAVAKERWGQGEPGRGAAKRSWEVAGGRLSLVRWKERTPEDFFGVDGAPEALYSLKLDLGAQ